MAKQAAAHHQVSRFLRAFLLNISRLRQALLRPQPHWVLMIFGFILLHTLFFSPVLLTGYLLAPGDAGVYYLPTFLSPRTLWDPNIWAGYPMAADQQTMTWYPPALIFSSLPNAWNLYVLSAYVLASCLTYGYVYQLTRCSLSGFAAGTIYGLSGFMVAHLGHTTMIHNAAWLPLILWSFENLRQSLSARWLLTGIFAIGLSALAGHPQILAYTLCLSGVYVAFRGWDAPTGRWYFYAASLALTILGVGLAGIQLIPAAELGQQSWRATASFTEFVTYRLPLKQIPTLLFPFLYGGAPSSLYGVRYFGEWKSSNDGWGITEVAGYAGLLPLMLAACSISAKQNQWFVRFWLAVGAVAFVLTLGDATPLAFLTFQIPVLKLFRAPARHFFEMSFALSVLAGLGVTAIKQTLSGRQLALAFLALCFVLAACLISLTLYRNDLTAFAVSRGVNNFNVSPFRNNALAIPLLVFLLASATLFFVYWQKKGWLSNTILIGALLIDLGSFGWFCEWNYGSLKSDYLERPAFVTQYKEVLDASHQRLVPLRGGTGTLSEIPPNISRFWQVPSLSGYGPLILSRFRQLLDMPAHGSIDGATWREAKNQSLNILSTRFLLAPPDDGLESNLFFQQGFGWATGDLHAALGTGCDPSTPSRLRFDVDKAVRADVVGVVSALACSAALPNDTAAAQVRLTDEDGRVHVQTLRVGRDTSEWASDCADVKPILRHNRAVVFRSYAATRESGPCEGHHFVSFLKFPELSKPVKSVEIEWVADTGSIVIQKMSLLDQVQNRSTPLILPTDSSSRGSTWRLVQNNPDGVKIYENQRALPRAWLVGEVAQLPPELVLTAIKTSRLPDGRAYDPQTLALTEQPLSGKLGPLDPGARVSLTDFSATTIELHVSSAAAAFLVLSDIYYPGWEATVDEQPVQIYQTNYVLRGLPVPPGDHIVRFRFRPRSLAYGAALSVLSLLLALALAIISAKFNFRLEAKPIKARFHGR